MPQPAPKNIKGWSPNPTWVRDHRPECVAAIGLIALAWTRVEDELAHVIAAIVGGAKAGHGGNLDWMVHNVMGEMETIRVRLKVIDAILGPLLKGNDLFQQWAPLKVALNSRSKDRNVAVHSTWAWSEDAPNGVLQIKKDGTLSFWVEKYFMDSFDRIKALEHGLHDFMRNVWLAIENGTVKL